ncbi:hypothetical protein LIER_15873 [Lithospermum erythrorhizon]|uniref:Retroviral polymerase SH3-like domain-containing protein n=1 Tax=Lithospermum erythrorhizon TaxID=34254 RepID=A0AAV3Q6F1_LITER
MMVDWECVQAMFVQWILNAIDSSLRKTIPYFDTTHAMTTSVGSGAASEVGGSADQSSGAGLYESDWGKLKALLGHSDSRIEDRLVAGYLINRTPFSVLNFKSPYELLYGKPPTYSNLRVFGALCFAHNQKGKLDKFHSRSRKSIFVGYPFRKKAWKLFDLQSCEYFVSRDVIDIL